MGEVDNSYKILRRGT